MSSPANAMREQILATPAALAAAFDGLERTVRLVLTTPEIFRTRRIVLTGSGDSYFAAKAAEMALLATAGVPVEVRTPLDAGRYHAQAGVDRDLENMLVVAISNSGGAARVAEAAGLYRRRGALVLAATKAPQSRLGTTAAKTLDLPALDLPAAPGFGPYLLTVVALLLLGIRFGEVKLAITMDEAQARRGELKRAIDSLAGIIAAADEPARSAARTLAGRPIAELLGAGPGLAVADYGAAKLLEAAGHHAYTRDLEEWAHLNYFDARPADIATVLIAPAGSVAESRAVEILRYLDKLGRAVVVIGGGEAASAATAFGHTVIPVAALPEPWSPLAFSVPVALIAAHLAEQRGAAYGRGSTGPWADSADASTVQRSTLWEPPV